MRYLFLVCLFLVACGHNNQGQQAAAEQVDYIEDGPPAPDEGNNADDPDQHFYVLYTDGEYGYEEALSQVAVRAGKATNPLIMFKYLGERDGSHQVLMSDADGSQIVSECATPCKYIKASVLVHGRFVRKEVLPAAIGSIGALVFEDAINGKLKPFIEKSGYSDLMFAFWFDGKQLLSIPQDAPKREQVAEIAEEAIQPTSEVGSKYENPTLKDMGMEDK